MSKKFILWAGRPMILDNCIDALRDLDQGKDWDVTIKRHANNKTIEQRGFFHLLCAEFAQQTGMQPGEIKEIAKAKIFGWRKIEYGGITLVVADGHSEQLNATRYGELIDSVYMLAGEAGINLPEPDKYHD